jgi:hypothetical protein
MSIKKRLTEVFESAVEIPRRGTFLYDVGES